jgi:prophage regulatory protein
MPSRNGRHFFWRKREMEKRIIRKPEIRERLHISDATVWRWEKAGNFPKRIQLGGNSVGWIEDEIESWINQKAENRA